MTLARGVALHVALVVGALSPGARAEGSRVVLLTPRAAQATTAGARTRLAEELRAAGFDVVQRLAQDSENARDLVEGEPTDADAPFATVLLRAGTDGTFTDVWVADHVTHKTVVRRIAARGAGESSDRALALRVVELMRASLVEGLVLPAPEPGRAPVPPPPDVASWTARALRVPARPSGPALELGLGVAAVFAGPDLGLAVAPGLRLAWSPDPAWSLGVAGVGPAFGSRVSAEPGTATVRQELAAFECAFRPLRREPVLPALVAGAGFYHLATTGYATPPYVSRAADVWAALLEAGADLRLPLAGAASLVLDVREMLALPRPVVSFAGQAVARAMQPGTRVGLSIAVELP